jgi:hypothetical protein
MEPSNVSEDVPISEVDINRFKLLLLIRNIGPPDTGPAKKRDTTLLFAEP